jgi:hypothetical protein
MTLEQTAYFLFGAGAATFLRNVWDYHLNTRRANADRMGAMVNWHLGFFLSWLALCLGVACLVPQKWYYGLVLLPFAFPGTFAAMVHG